MLKIHQVDTREYTGVDWEIFLQQVAAPLLPEPSSKSNLETPYCRHRI